MIATKLKDFVRTINSTPTKYVVGLPKELSFGLSHPGPSAPTSVEYNGRQLSTGNGPQLSTPPQEGSKTLVTVDLLEITLKGLPLGYSVSEGDQVPAKIDYPNGFKAVLSDKGGNRHYSYRYEIYQAGIDSPFALLYFCPRKGSVLDSSFCSLRVYNDRFYTVGWVPVLTRLISSMRLVFNNFTRVDIAVDGANCFDVYKAFEAGQIVKVGRTSYKAYKDAENLTPGSVPEVLKVGTSCAVAHYSSNCQLTGFDWGSRKSSRYMTVYNKSLTLKGKDSYKTYISDWWALNGMHDDGNVQRAEMKITNDFAKQIVDPKTGELGLCLESLGDSSYLAGVYSVCVDKFFEFVYPPESFLPGQVIPKKSRLSAVEVFDFDSMGAMYLEKVPRYTQPSEVWQAKRAVSKLAKDSVSSDYLADSLYSHYGSIEVDVDSSLATAIADSIVSYLSSVFPYKLPSEVVKGLPAAILRGLASCVTVRISRDFFKALPIVLARVISQKYGCESWFERKLRTYKLTHALMAA